MKSWNEIRKAATAFSKRWKNAFDEKAQAQSFLKEFFAVFGVDAVTVAMFDTVILREKKDSFAIRIYQQM